MKKGKNAIDRAKLRRLAEKALKETTDGSDDFAGKSPEEMSPLIHELRVHQIELEMQNEELQRIQEELGKTKNRYTHLYDFAPTGYFTVNKKGAIEEANLTMAVMLGVERSGLTGKMLSHFILKDDQDVFYKHRQRLLETEAPQICELRLVKKDGRQFFARLECVIIKTKGDEFGEIRAAVSDITESKRSEEALRHNEKRYRSLFNSIRDAILVADTNRTIIDCNQAFIDLFGYLKKEVLGKPTLSIYESEEEFRRMGVAIKDHMGDPGFLYIVNYQKRNGSVFPGETNVFYLQDDKGATVGFIGLIRDVTQSQQAQEDHEKLKAQLSQAQKMESIGNLAGGIAHDFNNILSSIIGFTELSLDEVTKGSDLEDHLQEVYTAGKRAKDLVRQILTFARQTNEEVKPIHIDEIVKESLILIRSALPTNIEIKKTITSDSLVVGNPELIQQTLMNIASNAADSMEENGGVLTVTVSDAVIDQAFATSHNLLGAGDHVKITVADTGTGIPPEVIHSIFEPYFTTKASGRGTGLGLASVHGTVKKYGGSITVESQPGQGSIFTILLPVTRRKAVIHPYQPETLPRGTERILFVDDELPIVKMGRQALERLGYEVTARTSSVEALELFQSKPDAFDLVVTDMTMPNLTGDRLAIELMKIRRDIPVILCTGYSKKIADETALEIGIKDFAYKPIVKADFAKTVRKVLDEAKG